MEKCKDQHGSQDVGNGKGFAEQSQQTYGAKSQIELLLYKRQDEALADENKCAELKNDSEGQGHLLSLLSLQLHDDC